MDKPKITNMEYDFGEKGTAKWWAYFNLENKVGGQKRFGVTKLHYKWQAKIDLKNKDKCKDYLKKRAYEYLEQSKNDYSKVEDEVLLCESDK